MFISGGPDGSKKHDGALYVFEADRGGQHWLIKARVSFPKGDRSGNEQYGMEVLQGYSLMPEKVGLEPSK